MATLYITEFQAMGQAGLPTWGFGPSGPSQVAQQPPVAEQTVSITGSSASSSAFNAATTLVRIATDVICSIEFGAAPTASATTARMAADQVEYFGVSPGMKIAVISNT